MICPKFIWELGGVRCTEENVFTLSRNLEWKKWLVVRLWPEVWGNYKTYTIRVACAEYTDDVMDASSGKTWTFSLNSFDRSRYGRSARGKNELALLIARGAKKPTRNNARWPSTFIINALRVLRRRFVQGAENSSVRRWRERHWKKKKKKIKSVAYTYDMVNDSCFRWILCV